MSDETYFVAAILSVAASAAAVWSSIRRRQLMRRVLHSLDDAQRREPEKRIRQSSPPVPTTADALGRVMKELDTALHLLEEVDVIGLWSKSDDSSDNRRRRQGLREADWAVSGALRALTDLRAHQPDIPATLSALEAELRVLVGVLEPLPHTVTDTMAETGPLDVAIREISREISRLLETASQLAAEHRGSALTV